MRIWIRVAVVAAVVALAAAGGCGGGEPVERTGEPDAGGLCLPACAPYVDLIRIAPCSEDPAASSAACGGRCYRCVAQGGEVLADCVLVREGRAWGRCVAFCEECASVIP